jgi:5-hydroxyisourate hydrolase
MTTLSTHVLDAALGRPAADLPVELLDAVGTVLEQANTDVDGRLRLTTTVVAGDHSIRFATGPWFAQAGRDTFFPHVAVAFGVVPGQDHYHVALLLSPYSYTTYRGS